MLYTLCNDLISNIPFKKTKFDKKIKSGNMLEINIPDAHFGKMAWDIWRVELGILVFLANFNDFGILVFFIENIG